MKEKQVKITHLFILILIFVFAASGYTQGHGLVELQKMNPNIIIDIRYATENNFTGKRL